ncbi:MAG TPA: DUF2846 domain-containing protein [Phenylobacterium sp.]|nr:DUF2846 domain-containing protein [Phenylobacterium sp.]
MRPKLRTPAALAGLVVMVGAAGPALAQTPAADPSTPAAAAPQTAAPTAPSAAPTTPPAAASPATGLPDGLSAPPEGKGQIVFFRPSNFVGMAVSFSVHEGDKGIAKLGNGSYAVVAADPGPHTYSIQFEATDKLNLEVEPGETYFVRQTIGVGVVAARPHLTPSDAGEFSRLKLKLSAQKPTDLKSASKAD